MATVLVVDDEPSIVDLLVELVEDAGHEAIAATNGQDALTLAQHQCPELIISDVMMPVMDGYALLQALRTDPHLGDTMVILISANTLNVKLVLSPNTTFVPKPLDLGRIERFLAAL